jgi:hypothetical protein
VFALHREEQGAHQFSLHLLPDVRRLWRHP